MQRGLILKLLILLGVFLMTVTTCYFAYQHFFVDQPAISQANSEASSWHEQTSKSSNDSSQESESSAPSTEASVESSVTVASSSVASDQPDEANTAHSERQWKSVYAYDAQAPWVWAPDAAGAYECVWRYFNPGKDFSRDDFVNKAKTDVQQVDVPNGDVGYGYQVMLDGKTYILTLTSVLYGGKLTTNAYKLYEVTD